MFKGKDRYVIMGQPAANKPQENKVSAAEILAGINDLKIKMDTMDNNNKKYFNTAKIKEEKTEKLENEISEMKIGIISLLDQIDVLLSAVYDSETKNIKNGLKSYYRKVVEIRNGLGIEEIPVSVGKKFNPKTQECKETADAAEYEEDTVVKMIQRGYIDKKSGNILRCAKVMVNKRTMLEN